ncbi:Zn(2+) transporter ZRC1 [Nakaseomyces bracarensis]|uniref:Zn(2+) transporter ZRC1 n=1 Tax=Nakaseomyces bracarensis TaxID=273131 RepID=UPI00387133EF
MLSSKEIKIGALLTLDTVFFFIEIIIGYMSHSLALIADSFHMLNDIFSLLVALWAVSVAKNRGPDARYTYGWKRAEILGALVNAVFLIALCFSIFIEALQRLIEVQEIQNPRLVLWVGLAGLTSNIVGLFLFHGDDHGHGHSHGGLGADIEAAEHSHEVSHQHGHGHEHSHAHHEPANAALDTNCAAHRSDEEAEEDDDDDGSNGFYNNNIGDVLTQSVVNRLASEDSALLQGQRPDESAQLRNKKQEKAKHRSLNMHGVFLHVLGDALGNVGVIAAALFIWKTDYWWRHYSDPAVSLLITAIIFSSAVPLSRRCSRILLQATPSTISAEEVQRQILAVSGVKAIHDFHIWNLTESIYIASIHVEIDCSPDKFESSARKIRKIFRQHGINSATVQPEFIREDVSADQRRRFSMLAGGSEELPPLEPKDNLKSTNYGTLSTSNISEDAVADGSSTNA